MPVSKKKKKEYFDAELTCKLLIEECESLRAWDKYLDRRITNTDDNMGYFVTWLLMVSAVCFINFVGLLLTVCILWSM